MHATTICNNAILTNYGKAARILQSTYEESGWLVPTHPAIKNEERRILRDKILFSGCKCPPCHLTIQTSSSSNLSLSDLDTIQGIMGLNCLPGFRPTHCKAKKEIESCLKLSSPGPQYLVFLEKYSWEIVTRHSMSSLSPSTSNQESQTSTAAPSPTGTSSSNTTAASPPDIPNEISEEENDERQRDREEREKKEAMFEFMVGNYCVRRFLDSAEKALSSFSSSTNTPSNPTNSSSKQTQLSKLSAKLRKRLRKSKQRVHVTEVDAESEVEEVILDQEREAEEEREVAVEVRETPQPRRMMFGEIPPSSLPLPSSNSDEKPLMPSPRKHGEGWEDGLFWYYRLHLHQPFLSFDPDFNPDFTPDSGAEKDAGNGEEEEEEVGGEVDDEKAARRHRGCFAVVRKGFGILSRRMEALFSSRCLGGIRGFRALEG
jgi:hypothetical protein